MISVKHVQTKVCIAVQTLVNICNMYTATAVDFFGSKAEIARKLGISRTAVSRWGWRVPEGSAYKLQSITKQKLKVVESLYDTERKTGGEQGASA